MAITLRREMLEAIQHKFPVFPSSDDLQWPPITPNGSPLPRPINRTQTRFTLNDPLMDSDDDDGDTFDENSLKKYWESIRAKYQSHTIDAPTLSSSQTSALPPNWTVVHITVTEDKRALFVTRQRGGSDPDGDPLVFCVPLKGRRENAVGQEEDEHLTFEDALGELKEIVRLSDNGTKDAIHIKGDDQTARARWWKERGDLDTRMRELLENIEFCWLGAFKVRLFSSVLESF
jgi:separase